MPADRLIVTLALIFSFLFVFLKQSPFRILLQLDENIASNWDLYLITILTLLLGMVIYLRRPPAPEPLHNQPNDEQQPPAPPQQPEQPIAPPTPTQTPVQTTSQTAAETAQSTQPSQPSQSGRVDNVAPAGQ